MVIKCGVCGEAMEIPDATAAGRRFKCPFCGETTEYGNPARIEVPAGADKRAVKPKIGIRRPLAADAARNAELEDRLRMAINPQPPKASSSAPKGVISAAEERIRMYEEMRRKEARQKMVKNFAESVVLLMAVVVLVGCVLWWQSHKNKVAAEAARIEAEAESDRLRQQEERDRLVREKREKDRQEREAARAREEEQRKMEREAKERAEREIRDNKERYHQYLEAFRENQFDLFTRSVTNGMEVSGGELCYLFPAATFPAPFYHVVCETNGVRRIRRVEESGKTEDVERDAFDEKVEGLEYLVVKGGKVFFKSLRKTPPDGILNMAKESDPAETFFGTLASTLKEIKPTYDELTFDILFTPQGSSRSIFVENLPFGCAWSRQSVREAIENKISLGAGGSRAASASKKRFKRTVKLWEGSQIKRGIDGITYVPRYPPQERIRTTYSSNIQNVVYRSRTRISNNSASWQVLYNQAVKEDAEEKAYYERQAQSGERNRSAAQHSDDDKSSKKVDKTLREGILSYHIRRSKVNE